MQLEDRRKEWAVNTGQIRGSQLTVWLHEQSS